jgi:hypothetical protein
MKSNQNLEKKLKENEVSLREIVEILEYLHDGDWKSTDDIYQDICMKYNLINQIAILDEILEDI